MEFSFADEIKRYPFIRLTLPLVLGIVLALSVSIPFWCGIAVLAVSLALVIFFTLLKKYATELYTGLAVTILLISLGSVITTQKLSQTDLTNLSDYKGFIIAQIYEEPKVNGNNVTLKVNVEAIRNNDEWISTSGKSVLYVETDEKSESLCIGDKIIFSPDMSGIENKGNPEEFDYKRYLAYNMIKSSDYLGSEDWQILDHETSNLRILLSRFRLQLVALMQKYGLSEDELAVMSAMSMGYSDALSDEVRHAYSSAGAMHILAVSGLHVGIIYGIITFLLGFMKNPKLRYLKFAITTMLIWLYATFTGLSPSCTRAALMFTLIGAAKLQKGNTGSLNSVASSMFILLIINPLNLVNIGFQLSYAAVFGIIIFQPKLYHIFTVENKILDWFWSLTSVSCAAQLATMPISFYYFHQFSNYFLLTNYVLIPLSTVAIWLCIIFFAVSFVPFLANVVAWCISIVAKSMNAVCMFIEGLPFSTTQDIYINTPQVLLMYLIIIAIVVFFFYNKSYKQIIVALVAMIFYSGINLYREIGTQKQKNIIVYNISKATAINVIDGADNIMFANLDSIATQKIERTAKNNWLKKGLEKEKYVNLSSNVSSLLTTINTIDNHNVFFKNKFIAYGDMRIFVLDDSFIPPVDGNKIDVDIIVLSSSPQIKLSRIAECFNFKKIVIDSSNSNKQCDDWLQENELMNFDIHNVKLKGAYILNL